MSDEEGDPFEEGAFSPGEVVYFRRETWVWLREGTKRDVQAKFKLDIGHRGVVTNSLRGKKYCFVKFDALPEDTDVENCDLFRTQEELAAYLLTQ